VVIQKLGGYENAIFYSECAIPEVYLMSDWRGGGLRPAYQSGILPALLKPIAHYSLFGFVSRKREHHGERNALELSI
jgi:hypothetical protein